MFNCLPEFLSSSNFLCISSGTLSNPMVGVSHHVSFMRPYGLFDVAAVSLANSLTLFPYVDSISDKMDYIGINYYGQVARFFLLSKSHTYL
jgi:hypothetical protein